MSNESAHDEQSEGEYRYKILAVDGGGIKGVFAASLLAEFETSLGGCVADHFDLIVGTSTGGIIALGLGLGLSAQDILEFYETNGPAIFPGGRHRPFRQLFSAKYDSAPLEAALRDAFGDRLLGESATRLVIPSLNLDTGQVHVFKTAHHERFVRDYKERVVDVAMATAAAPTYFPTHSLGSGEPLVDGGMWANNPMGVAAVEAIGLLEWPRGQVDLLGIGCTEVAASDRSQKHHGLVNYWARRIVGVFMAGQSSSSIGTAQLLLGHENVHRISPNVGRARYTLDGVDGIVALRALGATEARREFPGVHKKFLSDARREFTPVRGGAA